jgi:hypothetical protein
MIKFVAILSVAFFANVLAGQQESVNSYQQARIRTLYDSILTNQSYNINLRPYGVNGTDATYVYVQLRDVNVINVDPSLGVFTFTGYARREWVDPRLAYNDTGISYIPLSRDFRNIWIPDLYFYNGVETSTFPGSYHSFARSTRIYPNGRVFYSYRITQSIYCPALFAGYNGGVGVPGDAIVCPVRLGSYSYFSDELQVYYNGDGIYTVPTNEFYLPNYTFAGVTTYPTCTYGNGASAAAVKNNNVNARHTGDEDGFSHSCVQVMNHGNRGPLQFV